MSKGVRDPSSHRTPAQIDKQVKGYNHQPENIKKRSLRNKARRIVGADLGKAAIAGKDVGHKKMVKDGGGNTRSNLRVEDPSKNRAWRKK